MGSFRQYTMDHSRKFIVQPGPHKNIFLERENNRPTVAGPKKTRSVRFCVCVYSFSVPCGDYKDKTKKGNNMSPTNHFFFALEDNADLE